MYQIAQGDARLHFAFEAHQTDSGISSGITPVAAANATRPEPAGKEIPIGKRVWESPPVPTVSGSSIRFSQEWNDAVTRTQRHTARFIMKSGSVWCVFTSTGFGYAAVWQKDCITRSAEKPRHARSFSSSRSSGRWCPGTYRSHFRFTVRARTNAFHATGTDLPFFAPARSRDRSQRHLSPDGTHHCAADQVLHALWWSGPRPIISGIRPPARTSSISTSVFSSKVASSSPVSWLRLHLCTGITSITSPMFRLETSLRLAVHPRLPSC